MILLATRSRVRLEAPRIDVKQQEVAVVVEQPDDDAERFPEVRRVGFVVGIEDRRVQHFDDESINEYLKGVGELQLH